MNLNIKATNITLTAEVQDYFEKRLRSLDRIMDFDRDNVFAYGEIEKNTHHQKGEVYRAEVKINRGSQQYYVSAEGYDMYGAIDKMKDELAEQIRLNKSKRRSLFRRGALKVKNFLRFGKGNAQETVEE